MRADDSHTERVSLPRKHRPTVQPSASLVDAGSQLADSKSGVHMRLPKRSGNLAQRRPHHRCVALRQRGERVRDAGAYDDPQPPR